MNIQSMTGFARQQGSWGDHSWFWEIRSVNGKSLDIRYRLPAGFETLEPKLKELLSAQIQRGNVQIALQMESSAKNVMPVLNEPVFKAACQIANRASREAGLPTVSIDSILAIRGVIEYQEEEIGEADQAARQEALLESFRQAAHSLMEGRLQEGKAIASILEEQIEGVYALTKKVADDPSRSTENIKRRLEAQLASLLEAGGAELDPHRLHHEAAILATKVDLQEEIDRLYSHIEAGKKLLKDGGTIGRKLDFLCQEFNRECNTLCSKSNAVEVTRHGLEMKVLVDRLREQVQNIQ